MKMIFLVGDAPPQRHGDVELEAVLREARRREIRVHAIRAGNDAQTQVAWRQIAKQGRGTYASIAQSGGVVAVATPMDAELAELGRKLGETAIVYGDDDKRARVVGKMGAAAAAPAPAAADRASYYAASGASVDEADVLESAASGRTDVEELRPELLPAEMKPLSAPEKKAYVQKKKAERDGILRRMKEVSTRRDAYLAEQAAREPAREGGFDDVVTGAISEQGKSYGLAY
jgi:hypothetical protein